jgi:hypothetical protein
MKIIITENQSDKINDRIKSTVEKLGLINATRVFGNNKDMIRRAYEDNPLSYLNQFNNLKPVVKDDKIYYVDNNNLPLFFHYKNKRNKDCYINFWRIWVFFEQVMDYSHFEIEDILSDWLEETYNLKKLEPFGVGWDIDEQSWDEPVI